MSWCHFVLFVIALTCVTSEDKEECKDDTILQNISEIVWRCCNFERKPNVTTPPQIERDSSKFCKEAHDMAIKKNRDKGGDAEDVKSPEGFDCWDDCLMTKAGVMGQDKIINKEALTEYLLQMSGVTDEFLEALSKTVDMCVEKKFSKTQCPSGIDGVHRCIETEFPMNCPAKFWNSTEKCSIARSYREKCGAGFYMRY